MGADIKCRASQIAAWLQDAWVECNYTQRRIFESATPLPYWRRHSHCRVARPFASPRRDGTWRSSRAWVDEYIAARYKRT